MNGAPPHPQTRVRAPDHPRPHLEPALGESLLLHDGLGEVDSSDPGEEWPRPKLLGGPSPAWETAVTSSELPSAPDLSGGSDSPP